MKHHPRHLWLLLLALLCLWGCVPEGDGDGSPSSGQNNGEANNGQANNGDTNNGDNGGDNNANNGEANNGQAVELATCQDNTDCRGGEVCREGFCREACDLEDPCVGPLPVCDLAVSYCVGCGQDLDCGPNQICGPQQICAFFCRSDAACQSDQYCDDLGQCQASQCALDADCPGGFRCASGLCISIEEEVCEPGQQSCQENTALRCLRDGSAQQTQDCGQAQCQVIEGAAFCVEEKALCEPLAPGCDGEIAALCDEQGQGWQPGGQDCAAQGLTCQGGACVEP